MHKHGAPELRGVVHFHSWASVLAQLLIICCCVQVLVRVILSDSCARHLPKLLSCLSGARKHSCSAVELRQASLICIIQCL